MRPVLILALAAALGLPAAALAQVPGGEGAPTAVSGVTVEAALPCGPADSWRPNPVFDAPPDNRKTTRTGESPGTKAWVEKILQMFARPTMTDLPAMPPAAVKQFERIFPKFHQGAVCLGAIKSITFLRVSAKGFDVYEVEYANGLVEGTIAPLNARGEPAAVAFRPYTPQPASMRFHAFLGSLERGRPDYGELAPESAATLRAEWPTLQETVKGWGRLKMLSFARLEDDGAYAYRATYEHRQVVWTVFPPNADGKFGAVTHSEKAG